MGQTLLAIAVAFVVGAVFGYMVREAISRRRRARERQRFFYDNEPYGEATLLPELHGEYRNAAEAQGGPTRWSKSRANGETNT
jgi:hypothetical protein